MTGAAGLASVAGLSFAQPTQFLGAKKASQGLAGGEDGSGRGSSSASISGVGQLLGSLQQLQAQNPSQFQQVVAQIANQLQTAAQQQGQTREGQFLSNLASKFENVANGGSLSQLESHHHGHHAHQTYNSNGQSVSAAAPNNAQASTNADLQKLFAQFAQEVNQALVS
ncbi:MAG TPA: hypothetical protein VKU02_11285 [Gemmataceae bacterium]|nr:hypothetical protein [Gemmataceae bacterium]